jgi:iron-sulfur cluster repair protein YtfE (RIC family)
MNAIDLLNDQHDEVAELFAKAEKARTPSDRQQNFNDVADALAIHVTIEETIFYPAVRAANTTKILLESLEEHLAIKRVIADLLDTEATHETFSAKLKVLREEIEHHVDEEKSDLFPKVRKLMDRDQLEALGQLMQARVAQLVGNTPRFNVRGETDVAAPLA